MREIYVSVDIEADGPIPGPNSMLSLGAAAFEKDAGLVATFQANLEALPGAAPDPTTMTEFWDKNPDAWAKARSNQQPVESTMRAFVQWVEVLGGHPVFVGYPASYDFMFVYWYVMRFVGKSPFSFSALDIKTFAMARLGLNFRETTKKRMPKEWIPDAPHSHVAVDDAIEQGQLFMNMLGR